MTLDLPQLRDFGPFVTLSTKAILASVPLFIVLSLAFDTSVGWTQFPAFKMMSVIARAAAVVVTISFGYALWRLTHGSPIWLASALQGVLATGAFAALSLELDVAGLDRAAFEPILRFALVIIPLFVFFGVRHARRQVRDEVL